jgi:hypothetical protein
MCLGINNNIDMVSEEAQYRLVLDISGSKCFNRNRRAESAGKHKSDIELGVQHLEIFAQFQFLPTSLEVIMIIMTLTCLCLPTRAALWEELQYDSTLP